MLNLFGTCMVPAAKPKKIVCEKQHKFERIISTEDEALAIIILENNVAKWSAEVNKILDIHPTNPDILRVSVFFKEQKKDIPPSKFTWVLRRKGEFRRGGCLSSSLPLFLSSKCRPYRLMPLMRSLSSH